MIKCVFGISLKNSYYFHWQSIYDTRFHRLLLKRSEFSIVGVNDTAFYNTAIVDVCAYRVSP